MPPEIMVSVIPIPSRKSIEALLRMLLTFVSARNPGNLTRKITTAAIKTTRTAANFGTFRR